MPGSGGESGGTNPKDVTDVTEGDSNNGPTNNTGKLNKLKDKFKKINFKALTNFPKIHPLRWRAIWLLFVFLLPLVLYRIFKWVGLFVAFLFVLVAFRNVWGGKLIPVSLIMVSIVIFFVAVHPSFNRNYFTRYGALRGPGSWQNTRYGIKKINTGIFDVIHQTQVTLQRQIQCAEGNCPQGESDGPSVGMSLSSPILLQQINPIIGEKVYFSSIIKGYNLDVYPNVIIYPSCYVDRAKADVKPEKIPFIDISNSQAVVRCVGVTQPSSYYVNDLKVNLDFNFTTESDLRLFVMNDQTRTSLMTAYGPDFMSKVFGIQGTPVAKYNDGPINLGMSVTQYPIAARSDESATLIFALTNQWKGLNGKVVKINSMKIITPPGVTILNEKHVCPFHLQGQDNKDKTKTPTSDNKNENVYVLDDNFKITEPKTGIMNFFCGMKVNNRKKEDFPVWMPHLKVITNYQYEMTAKSGVPVYKNKYERTFNKEGDESGGGNSGGSDNNIKIDISQDCKDYKGTEQFSSYEEDVLVRAYETGDFSTQIKSAVNEAISKYPIPGWSNLSMKALLLSILCKETSMGTQGDDDGDNIPDHIAGCDVYDNHHPPDNIHDNIICAQKTLRNWYTSKQCSSPENNLFGLDRFDCTLQAYSNGLGKNARNNPGYRRDINYFIRRWETYLCYMKTN